LRIHREFRSVSYSMIPKLPPMNLINSSFS
jgi:hypothetical protein